MKDARKPARDRHYVILTKLAEIGPMNMLEIGFTASPQVIRNMAARGLVRVTVEMTARGADEMGKERVRRDRQKMKIGKEQRKAGSVF